MTLQWLHGQPQNCRFTDTYCPKISICKHFRRFVPENHVLPHGDLGMKVVQISSYFFFCESTWMNLDFGKKILAHLSPVFLDICSFMCYLFIFCYFRYPMNLKIKNHVFGHNIKIGTILKCCYLFFLCFVLFCFVFFILVFLVWKTTKKSPKNGLK